MSLRKAAETSKAYNKFRRVLSDISRVSWLTLVLSLPIVFVKTAGIISIEIGTRVGTVPFGDLILGLGQYVAAPILTLVVISSIADAIFRPLTHHRYEKMIKDLNAKEGGLTPAEVIEAERELTGYRKNINNEEWLSAKTSRREFYKLLEDKAMGAASQAEVKSATAPVAEKGGIDLGLVNVKVQNKNAITTAFDDPAMVQLLMNAEGLSPVIYSIQPLTPVVAQGFLGAN
jgi:hypothetical protein